MPWYYAGPEAKPVGPVTLEELHACRAREVVSPETYVIEHTGQPMENWSWKRYREVFPAGSALPPIPLPDPAFAAPLSPAPPIVRPQAPTPHPLFPSAPPTQPGVFPPTARPDPYYNVKPTNSCCAWGFGLGLLGFFLSFCCIGLFPALLSVLLSIIGLTQIHRNRHQAGQGLAIAGLILSGLAVLISLICILCWAVPMMKAHGLTVTEQTSNDSE